MKIAGRAIGPGHPVFLQAELGVTTNGNLRRALELVDVVANAGADAAKFICTNPDAIMRSKDGLFTYETMHGRTTRPIYHLLKETMFTFAEWAQIAARCRARGIIFYATVDWLGGLDLLAPLDPPAWKVSCWDLTWRPLLAALRATGKPVLVDVGTATREEVRAAIPDDAADLLFVHDPHPRDGRDWNMSRVRGFFQPTYPFGFSSPGRELWCDFVALAGGACLIEKRLTAARDDPEGHHHAVSLEPDEFTAWVREIRLAEAALAEDPFAGSEAAWADRKMYDRDAEGLRP